MATTLAATTPPPQSSIRTPTTPRFGGCDDNYQLYSPRKSARVSQRSRTAQTPPPQSSQQSLQAKTPRTTRKLASSESPLTTSPPSPQTASKRKTPRPSLTMSGRRVSGALNFESTASAAAALGLPELKREQHRATAIRNNGMLPTPAKTPKQIPAEVAPAIQSVARNLFPIRATSADEVMPSPKKKGKKYKGFTMDSFGAEEEKTPIQIYTDSHDRVPEVDMSADNPFYGEGNSAQTQPMKRASKRRRITIPGEGEVTLEEAEQRNDGLVYVFRGKKMFRKFSNGEGNETGEDEDGPDQAPTSMFHGRQTRSSIQPRLLFPSSRQLATQQMTATDDEEAETEIDEAMDDAEVTPKDQLQEGLTTPQAPRWAVTPPTTKRTTRSKDVDMLNSPAGPSSPPEPMTPARRGRGGKVSPFDGWQRTKGAKGAAKKRGGETLLNGGEKKQRP